ncbi:hypothetical protein KAW18_12070 [candidate division WOR-3 bacterium]|nr:hypothetical protein [candidate division WOR-3 bacterium]MCK4528098.1 hypothetical protein [candidate division WOR-3 bacterium]
MKNLIISLVFLVGLITSSPTVVAQERENIQKKPQKAGKIELWVTNMGMFGSFWGWVEENRCEYPAGSNCDYFDSFEMAFGGVNVNGDTCVADGGGSFGASPWHELFPDSAMYDSLWAYSREEEVDPIIHEHYSPEICGVGGVMSGAIYSPLSEIDFLAHYSDRDTLPHMTVHRAMGIDVYQLSYSWGYSTIEDIIFVEYYMKNTSGDTIRDFYIGFHCNLQTGDLDNVTGSIWEKRSQISQDDRSWYNSEKRVAVCSDAPGGEDGTIDSLIGWTIIHAPDIDNKDFTFKAAKEWDYGVEEERPDEYAYKIMTLNEIDPIQETKNKIGDVQWALAFGPYTFKPGSTIVVACAMVGGENENDLYENVDAAHYCYLDRELRFSPPPTSPEVTAIPGNHRITLEWDDSPESCEDTLRWDDIVRDFEGYRIYKSRSEDGPYTLIADFDKVDWYGYNVGLEHTYTDSGLLNGFNYYYAVTSYDLPDTVEGTGPKESSIVFSLIEAIPGSPSGSGKKVSVVPNPYRGDVDYTEDGWEVPTYAPTAGWTERDRKIQFINLPADCTIRIYTLTGDLVRTIKHKDPLRGWENWNLISEVNQAISSGIYVFSVQDHGTGKTQLGKFVVIK